MENFALIAVAESLKAAMSDLVIRRVVQQQPNGFIIQTRSSRLPALKVLMHAHTPALYASESKPPIEPPGSDFLMVLRKHLTSAELVEFRKPLSERIVEFVFKTVVPSKELEIVTLVLELLPNAPNIILLDMERRILASFSPITPQHGIGEFEPYAFPASGGRIDLERILAEDVPEIADIADEPGAAAQLMSRVAGLGPVFANEIVHRRRRSGRSLIEEIRTMLEEVRSPSPGGWIYTDLPMGHILEQNDLRRLEKAILSPIELESLERTHSSRTFTGLSEAVRFCLDEIESRTLLEQAKLPLLRDIRAVSKRVVDRERRLSREQKKYEEAEAFQKTAQMLTSSGMKMDQRYDAVTVTDYFTEPPGPRRIELDQELTLRENIDRMFKRHQKAGRGRQMVSRQLTINHSRQAALTDRLRRLQAIRDWDTWLAISNRITKEEANPETRSERDERGEEPRRHFRRVSIDGREILIGKTSRENDELTFQIATPEDFWLHVADYSGSHVVVRNPLREKDLPEEILLKAAQLAAFFSQARNSPKVEVHFTKRKHVTKPRRAKPGLVRLIEFKSINVEPKNWMEK